MPIACSDSRPPARRSSLSTRRIALPCSLPTSGARSLVRHRPMRRSAALALVGVMSLLAACAGGGLVGGASSSQPVSSAPVDVARYGRLLAMSDERRIDTALIQGIFRSGSHAERAAAALAVGQVHGSALAP